MKRGLGMLAALAALLGLLSGCGGSTEEATTADAATSESAMDVGDGGYGGSAMDQAPAEGESGEDRLQNAKLIYTADLTVETTAFDDAAAGLRQTVEDMGGYFETASVYDYGGDYRSASYTIRVPAEHFQALLEQVGELCHVVR